MAENELQAKSQRLVSSATKNPRKFYNNFLFKAVIVTLFIVIIPFFPSEPTIFTKSWELFYIVFVGIAVSYGLFSTKNDELEIDNNSINNNNNGQSYSYVSRLFNINSVFNDDNNDNFDKYSDDNGENVEKVETWRSSYVRNEPMIVVADENHGKNGGIDGEKPLLLPVRSLKSRVSDEKFGDFGDLGGSRVFHRSNTSPIEKGFDKNLKSLKSRVCDEKIGGSRVCDGSNSGVIEKGFNKNLKSLSGNDLIGFFHGEDFGVGSRGLGGKESEFPSDRKGISGDGSVRSRGEGSNDVFGDGGLGVKEFSSDRKGFSRKDSVKTRGKVSNEVFVDGDGDGSRGYGVKEFLSDRKGISSGKEFVHGEDFGISSRGLDRLDLVGNGKEFSSDRNDGVKSTGEGFNEHVFVDGNGDGCRSSSRSNSSLTRRVSEDYGELADNGGVEQHREKVEESVVLPSPIPWRSRSGRMEMKAESDEANRHLLPQSSSSSLKELSPSPNMSSSRKLPSSSTSLLESQAKSVQDVGRRKSNYNSGLPPPPPPPPPPRFLRAASKPLQSRQTFVNAADTATAGKSVRTNRPTEAKSSKKNPKGSYSEYPKETRDFLEQELLETDDESENESENRMEERMETPKWDEGCPETGNDDGPDVDKKADEFIAKFREQIRLQRIESIKKSTVQLKRSSAR